MKKRTLRSNQETDEGKRCAALANSLTKKAPYKGLGADSVEKHEPVSDIDTVVVDSLKALDPEWPIREADIGPIRLATNDLGARGAGPAATVCTRVIAARRPIPVHSFGEPCWIFGRSSHQFWRGTA
jgi:hypothetical protein